MYFKNNTLWATTATPNATLFDSDDSGEEDDHKSPIFDGELEWHVILGICLVSVGLLTVLICVLWSCFRKHCSAAVPKKIGRLKVIVRQPSVASLGDDIGHQRTWVTTTSISSLGESYPSVFNVFPKAETENSDKTDSPSAPPRLSVVEKEKRFQQFLNV